MYDRSSRPHHSPRRTPTRTERRIINVRLLHRREPARIAYLLSTSGDRAELLAQLTGRTSENHDFPTQYDMHGRSPEKQVLAHLRELTESGRPVFIGTRARGTGVENKMEKGLRSSHVYEVVSVDDKGLIQLRNPHNKDHPQPLAIKKFMKYCSDQ